MKGIIRKGTRGIDYLFMVFLRLFPVDDKCIVLHSKPDFSDNAWAFYKYLLDKKINKNHTIVWMVDDPNHFKTKHKNVVFVNGSTKGLEFKRDYYLAKAKCVIYTHRAPIRVWRKNQYLIHTSHSASQLKAAVGAGGEIGEKLIMPDFKLRCGKDGVERAKIGTHFPDDKFLVIGMPRLDLLFQHREVLPLFCKGRKYAHSIIALETFKQGVLWNDSEGGKSYGLNILYSNEELLELNNYLESKDTVLFIKPHRAQDLSYIEFNTLSNIIFLKDDELAEKEVQLYELLENCDYLLTDYSSVYYDFLLVDRPIGFLIGDIEEYKRGFIIDDPLSEMTGPKINSLDQLKSFISDAIDGVDDYKDDRKALIKRVFKYPDGKNCERLYKKLKELGLK